jgi:exosortase
MVQQHGQPPECEGDAAGGEPLAADEQRDPYLVPGLVAAGVLVLALYAPVLVWMVATWGRDVYYGHAYLIPPVVAFLIWAKRERLAHIPLDGRLSGCVLVLGGLLLHAAGTWVDVHFVSAMSFVVVLGGLVLWLWGTAAARELLFPIVYLLFMVPLGRLLADAFSNPLQQNATQGAVAMLRALGIPTEMQGASIGVPDYTFVVGAPCSGLKSIVTMTALAALLAYVLKAPLWKRLAVFAAAGPVAVAANMVRITIVVLVGKCFGEKAAEGLFHGASGVIVFVVGLLGLVAIGRVLGCRDIRDEF